MTEPETVTVKAVVTEPETVIVGAAGGASMVVALTVLGGVCIFVMVQYVRSIIVIRSLYRQLAELEEGSHMELWVGSRQRDLVALCRKLNGLRRHYVQDRLQYEKAEKQLKQSITSLAHDIRTPLTGAAGYLQLAREQGEGAKRERYLDIAGERLRELGDMLEQMFLFTKLTSAEFGLSLCRVQVLPLLSDCLVGFYRQFEEKGVSPEVDFQYEGVTVLADEEALQRIFHNLIQNALLHGRGGIRIRQRSATLVFENLLSKTSRPDPEQIFDQFYKADLARRKGSSGLGLFIVKELTERMEGRVRAEVSGESLRIVLDLVG